MVAYTKQVVNCCCLESSCSPKLLVIRYATQVHIVCCNSIFAHSIVYPLDCIVNDMLDYYNNTQTITYKVIQYTVANIDIHNTHGSIIV